MKRAALSVFWTGLSLASAAQPAAFDVASVKPAPPPTGRGVQVRMGGDPGRFDMRNASLQDLVQQAYGVKRYQIAGPDWMDSQRYDVTAKMPVDTPPERLQEMLQSLLAERFHLQVHREKRDLPAYVLRAAKSGWKLKPCEDSGSPAADGAAPRPTSLLIARNRILAQKATVAGFAEILGRLLDRPVVDGTGVSGEYDFTLEFTPDEITRARLSGGDSGEARPAADADGPSLFSALQEQLGLKLEGRKAAVDLVVIDRAEKSPTEN